MVPKVYILETEDTENDGRRISRVRHDSIGAERRGLLTKLMSN